MSAENVNNILGVTMEKIKEMVDVNTIVGQAISSPDGTIVIPVSKVTYGFAGGGGDLPAKTPQATKEAFMGGSAAGITIQPIAFLAIKNEEVKVLQIEPYTSSVDRAIEKIPDIIDKVNTLAKKETPKNETADIKKDGPKNELKHVEHPGKPGKL